MQTTTAVAAHERVLTELDHARLSALAAQQPRGTAGGEDIETLLEQAVLVPSREVEPDVVTMYTQILLHDAPGGAARKLTLCYPSDAEPAEGFVSVLSPVGIALLGTRRGALASWRCPDGEKRSARVADILFQPEASGDYLT